MTLTCSQGAASRLRHTPPCENEEVVKRQRLGVQEREPAVAGITKPNRSALFGYLSGFHHTLSWSRGKAFR